MGPDLSIKTPLYSWIQHQTGLHITQVNEDPVLLALKRLATESGQTQDGYAASLIKGMVQPQPFIDAITTHESFFLRHRRHMEAAIQQVIQPLLLKGVRPRVLSAPCAQGEEPYSFAMLLQESGITPDRVEITAVDIAEQSIQEARQGVYRKYALRQLSHGFTHQHFSQSGEFFKVHPMVRRSVKFVRMNLLTEPLARLIPGFHLIFCHNMLIYFDAPTRAQMMELFDRLLSDQGVLFVDSTEVPHVGPIFQGAEFNGVRYFHKHGATQKRDQTRKSTPLQQQDTGLSIKVPTHSPIAALSAEKAKSVSAPNRLKQVTDKRNAAEQAYRSKRFNEAIRLYDQIIEAYPLWASWGRLGKARVLADSGEEIEALEQAEAALFYKQQIAGVYFSKDDEADAHAIISLVLHNKGLKEKLREHLERVRSLNPSHEILKLSV